jgi:hypothetical protein
VASARARSKPRIEITFDADGEVWHRVASLARSGPQDNHYVVRTDRSGRTTLTFGDGVHGRRPPTGSSQIISTYRPARRYTAIVLQQGRVILDRDFNEAAPPRVYPGLYTGVVASNADPQSQGRLQVRVPAVLGAQVVWAMPCVPVGVTAVPAVGHLVWIAFEAGAPEHPVWVGTPWRSPAP